MIGDLFDGILIKAAPMILEVSAWEGAALILKAFGESGGIVSYIVCLIGFLRAIKLGIDIYFDLKNKKIDLKKRENEDK